MFQVPTVLFVGTTNLFRSRFAEAAFNHQAQARGIGWCACSRGLALGNSATAELPEPTKQALEGRAISPGHTAATPNPLTAEDLEMAYLIIGLSEHEHRPLVAELFPDWSAQFNFWEIDDSTDTGIGIEDAAPRISQEVEALIAAIMESAEG